MASHYYINYRGVQNAGKMGKVHKYDVLLKEEVRELIEQYLPFKEKEANKDKSKDELFELAIQGKLGIDKRMLNITFVVDDATWIRLIHHYKARHVREFINYRGKVEREEIHPLNANLSPSELTQLYIDAKNGN